MWGAHGFKDVRELYRALGFKGLGFLGLRTFRCEDIKYTSGLKGFAGLHPKP